MYFPAVNLHRKLCNDTNQHNFVLISCISISLYRLVKVILSTAITALFLSKVIFASVCPIILKCRTMKNSCCFISARMHPLLLLLFWDSLKHRFDSLNQVSIFFIKDTGLLISFLIRSVWDMSCSYSQCLFNIKDPYVTSYFC